VKLTRADWTSAAVLWLAVVIIFAAGAPRLGFYGDDGGWLTTLPVDAPGRVWGHMRDYVPGRHLHPLWQYLAYRLVGDPLQRLPAIHLVQSAVDGLAAAAFFCLLRRMGLPGAAALLGAAWFAFWPIYGEVHFWMAALPQNLISTLFAILFAITSLRLAAGHRSLWLWTADAALFAGALFTYDQTVLVLALAAALRLWVVRRFRFTLAHLPYLAAGFFYAWLRLTLGGRLPPRAGALLGNIRVTISGHLSSAAFSQTAASLRNTAPADWLLAMLVAAAIAVTAWRNPAPASFSSRGRLLGLTLLFAAAAYIPPWLWFVSPRHHYLPSAGLFAAAAVCLTPMLTRARLPALLFSALAIGVLAAAGRGESRFWEQAFVAKRRLFDELRPQLHAKHILVLDGFPRSLGPAPLLTAHDAAYAPALLYHGAPPLAPGLGVSLSGVPAHRGIFLETLAADGPPVFRYRPADRFLFARFRSWENGRLQYQTGAGGPLHYETLPPRPVEHLLHARREGDDLIVSLRIEAASRPGRVPAGLFYFRYPAGFHLWGRTPRAGPPSLLPVLLDGPGPNHHLRLRSFPSTDRIRVELYQTHPDEPPLLFASHDAPVEP